MRPAVRSRHLLGCHRDGPVGEAVLAGPLPLEVDKLTNRQLPVATHLHAREVHPTTTRRLRRVDYAPSVLRVPDANNSRRCHNGEPSLDAQQAVDRCTHGGRLVLSTHLASRCRRSPLPQRVVHAWIGAEVLDEQDPDGIDDADVFLGDTPVEERPEPVDVDLPGSGRVAGWSQEVTYERVNARLDMVVQMPLTRRRPSGDGRAPIMSASPIEDFRPYLRGHIGGDS